MDVSWDSLNDAQHAELDHMIGDIFSEQPENFEKIPSALLSTLVCTSFKPYRDASPPRLLREDLASVCASTELLRKNRW